MLADEINGVRETFSLPFIFIKKDLIEEIIHCQLSSPKFLVNEKSLFFGCRNHFTIFSFILVSFGNAYFPKVLKFQHGPRLNYLTNLLRFFYFIPKKKIIVFHL